MAEYGSLPFREQIDFFRQKVSLPTRAWTDLWEGMHARAFVVAGAMREELLIDLRGAVDKAISQGTTLAEFRRDFDNLVDRHGWAYNGGRNWRTRVIYETNLRTSYQTGRYQQMQAAAATRPYWRYRHNDSVEHPRPEHQAWDGLVLRHDDPFWSTHFPPNGWGCRCYVQTLSERDLGKIGKKGPDQAPPIEMEEKVVGIRGPSPRRVSVPKGIDPGFGYNVGEAAWGRPISAEVMANWQAQGADAWDLLTPGDSASVGRPERIPLDAPKARLGHRLHGKAEVATALRKILGAEEKAVATPAGLHVLVNAEALADHVDPNRAEYLPLIEDTLADPFEVWLAFERHKGTGKVVLRSRLIKAFDLGKGKGMLVVANATRGMLEAWTFLPSTKWDYLERQRRGMLLYGRD